MVSLLLMFACATPAENSAPADPAAQAAGVPSEAPGAPSEAAPEVQPAGEAWASFGGELNPDGVIPASDLLASPETFVGQEVVVEGRVADVCQAKGCWMVIADGDKTMRITMKDHGFSVDKQGAGLDCQVLGTVVKKEVDAETIAHYASESKNTDAMPETAPGATFEIEATAVRMRPAGG